MADANDPRFAAHLARASQAHAKGLPAECEKEARLALSHVPGDPIAAFLLGVSLLRQERFSESAEVLLPLSGVTPPRERIDPRGFQRSVELFLSHALRRSGQADLAVTHAELARNLSGQDPETIGNLGICLLESGRPAAAEAPFRLLMQLAPKAPFGFHGLASALQKQGKNQEAVELFRTAARLTPPGMPLLVEIAEALATLADAPNAESAARRAHEAAPSVRTDLVIASTLTERGKANEAEPFASDAVKRDPASGHAWAMLGVVQQRLGNRAESDVSLRESLRLMPEQGSAWYALVQNRNASEEMAAQMQSIRAKGSLGDSDKAMLDFALGQCYERLGRYGEAFEAFVEANALARKLKFGDEKFDRKRHAQEVWQAINRFENLDSRPAAGSSPASGPQPIFVVGMIRSGTTLVQQILSCHPDVGAGGEIPFWMSNWRAMFQEPSGRLDLTMLANLRAAYIRHLAELRPGKRYVVDKMPENYAIAGLLKLAFPDAPVVHLNRDPRDICVSIFTTYNLTRLKFMHDLQAIGFALGEYQKVMRRWAELLQDEMIEVAYENLASEPEQTTRQLVARCGLEWTDAFLRPEKNPHIAATPSVMQVKSPVYRSSVGRAEAYEPWMSNAWAQFS